MQCRYVSNLSNMLLLQTTGNQLMKTKIIATKEEVETLFDTEEKQEIFKKIITNIMMEIVERTVHTPFVVLHEEEV